MPGTGPWLGRIALRRPGGKTPEAGHMTPSWGRSRSDARRTSPAKQAARRAMVARKHLGVIGKFDQFGVLP